MENNTCIFVTSIRDKETGFIVDEVDEVTAIDGQDISTPPKLSEDCANSYMNGISNQAGKIVLLLDAAKMLTDDMLENLTYVGGMEIV